MHVEVISDCVPADTMVSRSASTTLRPLLMCSVVSAICGRWD